MTGSGERSSAAAQTAASAHAPKMCLVIVVPLSANGITLPPSTLFNHTEMLKTPSSFAQIRVDCDAQAVQRAAELLDRLMRRAGRTPVQLSGLFPRAFSRGPIEAQYVNNHHHRAHHVSAPSSAQPH